MTVDAGRRLAVVSAPIGWVAILTVVVCLGAVGCSGQAGAALPPDPPTVQVEITDDDLVYDQPVPAGRVVFVVANAGETGHRLALVPLPDDVPPIHEQLQGDTRRQAELLARVATVQPGETDTFAVDLAEGQRYAMIDFSQAADGTMHGQLGVASEFRAGGQAASPSSSQDP